MLRDVVRTCRYARSWKTSAEVSVRQIGIDRDGVSVPATLVVPAKARCRLPGWIAIGGVSRRGRFHPQLERFAEALSSTGAAVLVPEIPEWTRLDVSPRVTTPTIRACVDSLNGNPDVVPGRFGVIGFSFGAPGVAIAASRSGVADQIAGIVLFGGYCSLERTLTCQLTGRHEWNGVDRSLAPDPYGRWVVASNHLTAVPECEDAGDVATALRRLAAEASGRRIPAWDPYHDRMIGELRRALPERRRAIFDYFATPTDAVRPSEDECLAMAARLTAACRRVDPLLDPGEILKKICVPTQVIHGRGDRLVPFTEGLRLMSELPSDMRRGATVTSMFNHSADHVPESCVDRLMEGVKLFGALRRMVNTV